MMQYTKKEIEPNLLRQGILAYLEKHQVHFFLPEPSAPLWDRGWVDKTEKVGQSLDAMANAIYQGLLETGQIHQTLFKCNSSSETSAYENYYPVQIKTAIIEELWGLVQSGVLIQLKYKRKDPHNFDFEFQTDTNMVLLSSYGKEFINNQTAIPYFTESYLNRLRETAEPDEELQGYLSEGLACLRNGLGRASAMLLRLALEHVLGQLIDASLDALASNKSQHDELLGEIRKAGVLIEKRVEVILLKLEHTPDLIPPQTYFRDGVKHRLRASIHSVRGLGGNAAHLSTPVQVEDVQEHYTIFASTVYPFIMKIIKHQKTIP